VKSLLLADDAVDRAWREVEARARSVEATAGGWPCLRGCSACCRSLAEAPRATRAEWARVARAVDALAPEARGGVRERLAAMARASAPYVCPMLDAASGRCLVYDARPTACRTYGYYVDGDGDVKACADVDRDAPVVWGNEAAVETLLARDAGPPVGLGTAT